MALTGFSSTPQALIKVTPTNNSIAAGAITEVTFTGLYGVLPTQAFIVTPTATPADLAVLGAYCTTAGSLVVRYYSVGGTTLGTTAFYVMCL